MAEPVKWKIDTNDRYSKIVVTVISLATGSLVLPTLFLREFLGVPKEKALVSQPLCLCRLEFASPFNSPWPDLFVAVSKMGEACLGRKNRASGTPS